MPVVPVTQVGGSPMAGEVKATVRHYSHHCTPTWVTERDSISKKKKRREKRREEGKRKGEGRKGEGSELVICCGKLIISTKELSLVSI